MRFTLACFLFFTTSILCEASCGPSTILDSYKFADNVFFGKLSAVFPVGPVYTSPFGTKFRPVRMFFTIFKNYKGKEVSVFRTELVQTGQDFSLIFKKGKDYLIFSKKDKSAQENTKFPVTESHQGIVWYCGNSSSDISTDTGRKLWNGLDFLFATDIVRK